MESPGRGRGRLSTRKRHTFPARSSSQRRSEPTEIPHSTTPAANVAPSSSSFTFETPSPSHARGTRMRTRNVDGPNASPEDPNSKGGRSLRKRTRVDYSFDQADEDERSIEAKATPTNTRALKKRKTDLALADPDLEQDLESRAKRRASEQPPKSTVRRNVGRKPTVEPQSFVAEQPDEDVPVQDTIEVGGHHSVQSSEKSSDRRTSSASSQHGLTTSDQPLAPETLQSPTLSRALPYNVRQLSEPPNSELDPPLEVKSEDQPLDEIPKIEIQEEQPITTYEPDVKQSSESRDSPVPHTEGPPFSAELAAGVDNTSQDPYLRLTPYIEGATVLYPTTRPRAPRAEAEPDAAVEETPVEDTLDDLNEAQEESTPAGSPGPMEDTALNSPAPEAVVPEAPTPVQRKQYAYKKLRPAQEFIDFLADYETLSHEELYRRLEFISEILATYQKENIECRKIIDDEENSIKYHQEEAMYQHRIKMARSKDPDANPLRKDFVVKGIRAPKPDAITTYARQQDKIMADAYGFEYDDRDSKIGQQDPIGQRGGVGKGRLRDRPKQTAKAAEADDGTVLPGKRPRKVPNLFGGAEPVSRSSTPVPTLPRKRRGRQPAEESNGLHLTVQNGDQPVEEVPKKRKGGRPRKHPLPVAIPEDTSAPEPEPEIVEPRKPGRKRRRRNVEDEDFVINGATNGQPMPGVGTRRRNSRLGEIPSGSFYSATSMGNDESRPATSSSTATASTTMSMYGLREKRQTKFSIEDDDEDFHYEEEQPKPKRIRRVSKKVSEQDFANITPSNIPTSEPDVALPPKVPKIRVKGFQPSAASAPVSAPTSDPGTVPPSSSSTPGQIMDGMGMGVPDLQQNGDNKGYNQMTKSEKMSASMKARWASGSMSRAVEKRRATLAAKKAAAATPVPEGPPDLVAEQQQQQQQQQQFGQQQQPQ